MISLENMADLTNPDTGKTYREENLSRCHNIPIGSLVEVCKLDGIRLHVVAHTRDCDGSPLYSLGILGEDVGDLAVIRAATYPIKLVAMFHGYGEEDFQLVRLPGGIA